MSQTPLVAFLNPPWWVLDDETEVLRRGVRAGSRWPFTEQANALPDNFRIGSYLPAPQFLMSAAAWTKRALPHFEVVVRDSIARGESYNRFNAWWQSVGPEFVIIEIGAASFDHDIRLVKAMKQSNPAVQIALAGPPIRELSKKVELGLVDAFLLGEYEKNAVKFVLGARGVIGHDLLSKPELKSAPFPLYDEDAALHYFDANPKGQQWPHLQLWASRGCFAVCNFCAWPSTMTGDDPDGKGGRPVRFYDPEWLFGFISERMEKAKAAGHPLKSIYFDDDSFNLSAKHVLAVCEVMKRIGLPWFTMCRADTIDRNTWMAMRDAGCAGTKLGFESGSQRVIDELIHKKLDLKEAEETARWLRSIGMSVHTTWAIGSPGERPDERQLTLDTIQRFRDEGVHDTWQISGMAEIPGTPLATAHVEDASYVPSADGALQAETLLKK